MKSRLIPELKLFHVRRERQNWAQWDCLPSQRRMRVGCLTLPPVGRSSCFARTPFAKIFSERALDVLFSLSSSIFAHFFPPTRQDSNSGLFFIRCLLVFHWKHVSTVVPPPAESVAMLSLWFIVASITFSYVLVCLRRKYLAALFILSSFADRITGWKLTRAVRTREMLNTFRLVMDVKRGHDHISWHFLNS